MGKLAKRRLVPKLTAGVLLMLAGMAVAGPNGGNSSAITPKATAGSLTNINLVTDTCAGVSGTLSVTATGSINDGGGNDTIWFTIFDDGIQKFAQQISIPVGTTTTTVVAVSYPGVVGGSAPGIGLELGETQGSNSLVDIDPFFPTAVGGTCSVSAGGPVPTPTLSEWSLISLAGVVGLLGLGVLLRRKQA